MASETHLLAPSIWLVCPGNPASSDCRDEQSAAPGCVSQHLVSCPARACSSFLSLPLQPLRVLWETLASSPALLGCWSRGRSRRTCLTAALLSLVFRGSCLEVLSGPVPSLLPEGSSQPCVLHLSANSLSRSCSNPGPTHGNLGESVPITESSCLPVREKLRSAWRGRSHSSCISHNKCSFLFCKWEKITYPCRVSMRVP